MNSNGSVRILHLEDDPLDRELVAAMLAGDGISCALDYAESEEEFRAQLGNHPDLILSDFTLPGWSGLNALQLSQEASGNVPFVFYSGTLGEDVAIHSLRNGATDYVLKQRPGRLPAAVRRALSEFEGRRRRREAEAQIHAQAELLDRAHDAIVVHDLEGRILYWNQGAAALYEWTAAEAVGRRLDIFPAAPDQRRAELLGRGEWMGELRQSSRSGRAIVVESRQTMLRHALGASLSILCINTDVTEKKHLEELCLRAQRLESLGALTSGIAHDLNNVLAPILLASDVVLQGSIAPRERKMIEIVRASAARGSSVLQRILSFARDTKGQPGPVELGRLVTEVLDLVSTTFSDAVQVATVIPDDLPPLHGDATQLYQALLNLCVNARDAMPEGGELTVRAALVALDPASRLLPPGLTGNEWIRLTVADTGVGIPPEVRARIFEPFFTTKGPEKGTGLGLSNVRSIIKRHGGFIDVASEPGRGTQFSIFLPPATGEQVLPPSEAAAGPMGGRGELILVVDNEIAILEMVRSSLACFNYRVLTAGTSPEALAIYSKRSAEIELVVADLQSPVADGRPWPRPCAPSSPRRGSSISAKSPPRPPRARSPCPAPWPCAPCSGRCTRPSRPEARPRATSVERNRNLEAAPFFYSRTASAQGNFDYALPRVCDQVSRHRGPCRSATPAGRRGIHPLSLPTSPSEGAGSVRPGGATEISRWCQPPEPRPTCSRAPEGRWRILVEAPPSVPSAAPPGRRARATSSGGWHHRLISSRCSGPRIRRGIWIMTRDSCPEPAQEGDPRRSAMPAVAWSREQGQPAASVASRRTEMLNRAHLSIPRPVLTLPARAWRAPRRRSAGCRRRCRSPAARNTPTAR